MTLSDIKAMDKDMLTPDEVGQIVGCSGQVIRVTAKNAPQKLGFPVICVGSRTRIPRIAFIRYCEGGMTDASTGQ